MSWAAPFRSGRTGAIPPRLSFWYYGQKSGKNIKIMLTNKQAGAGDPSKWKLAWSDEFNTRSGTTPNSSVWGNEVGDGTVNGIPGWGNDELEYYTAGSTNAATDGQGNLVITTRRPTDRCNATTARASIPRRGC